jgi:hypothetical protein
MLDEWHAPSGFNVSGHTGRGTRSAIIRMVMCVSSQAMPGDGPSPEPMTTVSRRGLLRGAAGIGAATAAAGLLVDAMGGQAAAATAPRGTASGTPIVAHLRDVNSGEIDLFVGTRHLRVRDHKLAARLADAAS